MSSSFEPKHEKPAFMIRLASTCTPHIFQNYSEGAGLNTTRPKLLQTGLFMIRPQLTVAGDLDQEIAH